CVCVCVCVFVCVCVSLCVCVCVCVCKRLNAYFFSVCTKITPVSVYMEFVHLYLCLCLMYICACVCVCVCGPAARSLRVRDVLNDVMCEMYVLTESRYVTAASLMIQNNQAKTQGRVCE